MERFVGAARDGDLAGLERLLAADVVAEADGRGRVHAARAPVRGAAAVTGYLARTLGGPAPGRGSRSPRSTAGPRCWAGWRN